MMPPRPRCSTFSGPGWDERPSTASYHTVAVHGTRTDDGASHTLLAVHETGGTWMIHSLNSGAVRLPEAEAVRMAKAILHRVSARVEGKARRLSPQDE